MEDFHETLGVKESRCSAEKLRIQGACLLDATYSTYSSGMLVWFRRLLQVFMRKRKFPLVLTAAVLFCQQGLLAQGRAPVPRYREEPPFDLKVILGTTGDWRAVVRAAEPGRDSESEGPSESTICFVRTNPGAKECAYFRDLFHSNLPLQVFSSLTPVLLESGSVPANGLELKAAGLYPSGQLQETAIWVYDTAQDDWHLALAVESNEVRIFSKGALNGLLVTSDWHREEGDTRWSDHRRDITVYRYHADRGQVGYRKLLEYTTAKKYGAEDTNTVDAELNAIEAKLK